MVAATALLLMPISSVRADDTPSGPKAPQADGPRVTISVDGLSCPFCVYGLEKKLKKVKGVKTVKVELQNGLAVVTLKAGQPVDTEKTKAAFRAAVKKAGFTARKITVSPGSKKASKTPAKGGGTNREQQE